MSLTQEDIQTIKDLLKEQGTETERRITTLQINLERKLNAPRLLEDSVVVTKLRREIQTSENNLKQSINLLEERLILGFKQVDKRLDSIVQDIIKTIGKFHEDHEKRVIRIEKELQITG